MLPRRRRGQTVPGAVIGGAGAWHAFLLRRRNVPLTGERVEVLRLHVPQTWGPLENLSPTVLLGEAPSKARAGHLGVVSAAEPTTPLSSARDTHGGAVRTARRDRPLGRAAEVRALSEVFSGCPPFEGLQPGSSVVRSPDRPLECPACDCGSTTRVFHSFSTARWGMNVGPNHAAGSPPSHEPELPGEFVSDDLRDDCARFLHELKRLVELRRELTPDSAAWAPGPSDRQPPPNSRSAQSGQ